MSAALIRAIADLEADLKMAREQRGNPLPGLEHQEFDDWIAQLEKVLAEAKAEAAIEEIAMEWCAREADR